MKDFILKYKKLLPLAAVAVVIGVFWAVKNKKAQEAPSEPEAAGSSDRIVARTFKVTRAPFEDVLTMVGDVRGGSEIELRFEKEGKVVSFPYKEGDFVKAGAVIASLDSAEAKLRLDHAEISNEENRKLFAIGSIVKSKLEQTRIEAEMARLEYKKSFLTAPQSGFLTQKNIEVGEMANPGLKAGLLVDVRQVSVELGVIEKNIEKIRRGQDATVTVDAYPGTEFPGKVTSITPSVEGKGRTLTAKAVFENPRGQLLPGMFARCRLVVFQQKDALVVPNESVTPEGEGSIVFVVEADGTARKKPVLLGHVSEAYSLVKEGLSEGDVVIMENADTLVEGKPVESTLQLTYGQKEESVPEPQKEEP